MVHFVDEYSIKTRLINHGDYYYGLTTCQHVKWQKSLPPLPAAVFKVVLLLVVEYFYRQVLHVYLNIEFVYFYHLCGRRQAVTEEHHHSCGVHLMNSSPKCTLFFKLCFWSPRKIEGNVWLFSCMAHS